jgi:hypothetical protein
VKRGTVLEKRIRDGPGEENKGRSWEKRIRDGPERRE